MHAEDFQFSPPLEEADDIWSSVCLLLTITIMVSDTPANLFSPAAVDQEKTKEALKVASCSEGGNAGTT